MNSKDLANSLAEWLSNPQRLVIAGIGNALRGDDGLGVEFAKGLVGKIPQNVLVLDCGTVPETYLGPIRGFRPTHILMVDAADIGSEPGSARLILPQEIIGLAISTHSLPLNVLANYLKEQTHAKIALLAIQPKDTEFGEKLSQEVQTTLRRLSGMITNLLGNKKRVREH